MVNLLAERLLQQMTLQLLQMMISLPNRISDIKVVAFLCHLFSFEMEVRYEEFRN
jgi:hypothetical protein